MYLAEQTYGGTFRIATVLTLCSPNPLTAARLTAAIDAVAARHDALRTVVIGQEFVVAPPTATPTVDVKAVAEDAEGVTAAAFADAQSVLAAGTSGAWTNPPLPAGAAAHTPISLPWRAGVYLPAPGSTHAPTDAAAVVYYLPHYLSDGTSVDVLAAATIDALTAASSAGVVAAGQVGMAAAGEVGEAAAGEVVPLAPAVNDVYPPQGGACGRHDGRVWAGGGARSCAGRGGGDGAVGVGHCGGRAYQWAGGGARRVGPDPNDRRLLRWRGHR